MNKHEKAAHRSAETGGLQDLPRSPSILQLQDFVNILKGQAQFAQYVAQRKLALLDTSLAVIDNLLELGALE